MNDQQPENRGALEGTIETDALIIGAGPVGLFQVFELGLQEIQAHVVDALPYAGGQCIELYPDKPIYDIPGVPRCTGRELIEQLLRQIAPFRAPLHLGQEVSEVRRRDDGRFHVETTLGTRFTARSVFIAGGVGSFQPRKLKLAGLESFEGSQLLYHVKDPAALAGRDLVVLGDEDPALECAIRFAQDGPHRARSVTLIHRRDAFRASAGNVARMRELCATHRMQFLAGQVTGFEEAGGQLRAVKVSSSDGVTRAVALDTLLVLLGLSPKLGPIADWGLELERKQLVVDTEKFETREPGIFAVGDINTYPGKRKLILCGFHEATLAAFGAAARLFPGQPIPLQYTTTSTRLHEVLKVAGTPSPD